MTHYLGIDGGGSKTCFLLVDANGQELARIETGASNYISVGRDASQNAIEQGIRKLPLLPDVVCAGFAGAGNTEGRNHYTQALRILLPNARIITETDAFIAYVGAVGLRPGLLLVAGTGAIAVGRRPDGTMFRCGGWGAYFGDEGSGFWIGREAVRVALQSLDFQTNLGFAQRIAEAIGLESVQVIPTAWASGTVGVPQIAALAPVVMDEYPAEPAKRIVEEAARHLRELTESSSAQVDSDRPYIAATGGIAAHPLMQELIGLDFHSPVGTPERGAITWAKRHEPT